MGVKTFYVEDVPETVADTKEAIQTLIEDKLAKLSLTGKIKENCVITADRADDEITITAASFDGANS